MRFRFFRTRRRNDLRSSAEVQLELTYLIFQNLLPTVLLGCISLVLLTALMAQAEHDPGLIRFSWIMLTVSLLRLAPVVAFVCRADVPLTYASAARWRTVYGWATFLYCFGFASETFYTYRLGQFDPILLATMGTFALCAFFSARVGLTPWVGQSCCFTLLAALLLGLQWQGRILAFAGSILLAAFAYIHCRAISSRFEIAVEQRSSARRFRSLAEHDSLTGLANRRQFQQALAELCREQGQAALFFLDLDRFKEVNDTWGHTVGDLLLQQVAHRLRQTLRKTDLIARLGGDEFAVLLSPLPSLDFIQALARRVNDVLAAPFQLEGRQIEIGASIGVRISGPEDLPQHILSAADDALYRVKNRGGGGYSLSADPPTPSMPSPVSAAVQEQLSPAHLPSSPAVPASR